MNIFSSLKNRSSSSLQSVKNQISKRPFTSFLVALAIFLGLMAASSAINKPQEQKTEEKKPAIEVASYYIGTSPKVQAQAQVKKTGVITIYAQSAGVVQQVYKKEGDQIAKGQNLVWISTSYTGGTISTEQRKIAETNYNSTKNNLQTNKSAIADQRQIAELNRENTEELRKITQKSADETNGVIQTNDTILRNLVTNIEAMEATGSATQAQLDALKAQQAQLQSGINQLRAANRNAEYQTNTDNPPTKLADLQKELTLKQLDLQEKALDLQLEVARLNLRISQISESLNYPATPVAGTIERINVQIGDLVNPGQAVATIVTTDNAATAEVFVPQHIANKVSQAQDSIIHIGRNTTVETAPSYISTQPTNGSLYNIKYTIPGESAAELANNAYVTVEIPVGTPNTSGTIPFIPLDAIYQTQDGAYVYIAEKGDQDKTFAKTRKITLGQVTGNYVEVVSGLSDKDIVIVDRNVLEGDEVTIKEQISMEVKSK